MLSTINGIDLLLTIIITVLGFRVYQLNQECESYVGQIMQVSWELQQEIEASKAQWEHSGKYCGCADCVPF